MSGDTNVHLDLRGNIINHPINSTLLLSIKMCTNFVIVDHESTRIWMNTNLENKSPIIVTSINDLEDLFDFFSYHVQCP